MEKSDGWNKFQGNLDAALHELTFNTLDDQVITTVKGFSLWVEMVKKLQNESGCLYLIGNGASSSMCSHFAADLTKNAHIRTQVFTDAALLTAVGNDISFERIFAESLLRTARAGDLLLTISSSGNSPNIIAGIEAARRLKMIVITLSGMNSSNASRRMGNLNIYVPGETYGIVETAHAAILHYWTDMLVQSAHA